MHIHMSVTLTVGPICTLAASHAAPWWVTVSILTGQTDGQTDGGCQIIKRLRGYKNLTYIDRLTKLALPSLELRRLHLDLIYCYKIVFGLIKLNFLTFEGMPTNFTNQEAGMLELFFACRVVNVWHSLPDTVRFTSLAVCKRCITTVDFSEFLMCNDV